MRGGSTIGWLCFVTLVTAASASFAAEKIGFVNMGKLFDNYEKTIQEDKILAEKGAKKTAEREVMVQEVRRLKDELAILSNENKEEKQVAIDEKLRELQDFDRSARLELEKERKRVFREVLNDIEAVINEYGGKNGFQFIFHDSALLYKTEKLDVTEDVLAELNNRFRKQKQTTT